MHKNSLRMMKRAVETVEARTTCKFLSVLDVGSRVVAGERYSYRSIFQNSNHSYTGVDIEPGDNVNLVLNNPYQWVEIQSESFDLVISGQMMEHVPLFWEAMKEVFRVTRPGGFVVLIVPSKGAIHRYPVDCYRFNPDGLCALAKWIGLNVVSLTIDSGSYWGDLVLIAHKPDGLAPLHEGKLLYELTYPLISLTRAKRLGQIFVTLVAATIGDDYFMRLVSVRNVVRRFLTRYAKPKINENKRRRSLR